MQYADEMMRILQIQPCLLETSHIEFAICLFRVGRRSGRYLQLFALRFHAEFPDQGFVRTSIAPVGEIHLMDRFAIRRKKLQAAALAFRYGKAESPSFHKKAQV